MPDLFLLDRKAALAADIKVREEVKAIIDEFGLSYFIEAQRELIELERRAQLERVKRRTVPGRFHVLPESSLRHTPIPRGSVAMTEAYTEPGFLVNSGPFGGLPSAGRPRRGTPEHAC